MAHRVSALAEALVAAQAELPTAIKRDADGEANGRAYKYLTLDKLIAATRTTLQAHGLTIVQTPTTIPRGEDGMIPGLRTLLWHVSGEHYESVMPLYLTDKTMQGLGAAITYARRYAWQSVLGIAAEEDTDAKDEIPF
jgi:ERF superfamily